MHPLSCWTSYSHSPWAKEATKMISLLIPFATAALLTTGGKGDSWKARRNDPRMGAVVYQVFPDRFWFNTEVETRRHLYSPPKSLIPWGSAVLRGIEDEPSGLYGHELTYTGGDLNGIREKLDYIQNTVGADVLFINPIWKSNTNHHYDTTDYYQVAPELGNLKDLRALVKAVHARKMRIVLDSVFNHVSQKHPIFLAASSSPNNKYRQWFYWDTHGKARRWFGVNNLPALNLNNKGVLKYIEAVVRWNVKENDIDGIRLDAAFEMGPFALKAISSAAHKDKPGSLVVGELLGYPSSYWNMVDGSYNYSYTKLCEEMLQGSITGGRAGRILEEMLADAGIDFLLRSWAHVDNHDSVRIATRIPDLRKRKCALAMQHLLPGCPVVYYGSELGMTSDTKEPDPSNRACMRWDMVKDNRELKFIQDLIRLRKTYPAIRDGDLKILNTTNTLAFARITDKVRESVIVIINATDKSQHESIPSRMGNLIGYDYLEDQLKDQPGSHVVLNQSGFLSVDIPAYGIYVLAADVNRNKGFSAYDNIP